jgi:hypothetical protein
MIMNRLAALILAALAISPAAAQTDLLNTGKGALQSLGGNSKGDSALGAGLSDGQISGGLKDALRIGTQKAVATVGHPGGFLNDRQVHIPLPGPLEKVKMGLSAVGASGMADDLEQRINKAAETAAPQAAGIFGDAVGRMSIQDARGILTGPQDSATQYFKRTTTPQLTTAMRPIIDQSLANVGALQSYNALTAKAKSLPFASGIDLDLGSYVVGKTLDGIFFYLARQEADIRTNPAARTTDALRTVFK